MVRMGKTNEQLCLLAQKGDTTASELLLKNNDGFLHKIAIEFAAAYKLEGSDLCIDLDDLVQEGSLGLLSAIPKYDPSHGVKFLTYAAPAIRNAMTDLIKSEFSRFEFQMVSGEDGLPQKRLNLNDVVSGEEREQRIKAVGNPTVQSPEDVCIQKETLRELYQGLESLNAREQTYLLYRYGFTDDVEHPLIGTAIHFHLSESRAKKLESTALDDLRAELPWWD